MRYSKLHGAWNYSSLRLILRLWLFICLWYLGFRHYNVHDGCGASTFRNPWSWKYLQENQRGGLFVSNRWLENKAKVAAFDTGILGTCNIYTLERPLYETDFAANRVSWLLYFRQKLAYPNRTPSISFIIATHTASNRGNLEINDLALTSFQSLQDYGKLYHEPTINNGLANNSKKSLSELNNWRRRFGIGSKMGRLQW